MAPDAATCAAMTAMLVVASMASRRCSTCSETDPDAGYRPAPNRATQSTNPVWRRSADAGSERVLERVITGSTGDTTCIRVQEIKRCRVGSQTLRHRLSPSSSVLGNREKNGRGHRVLHVRAFARRGWESRPPRSRGFRPPPMRSGTPSKARRTGHEG